MSPTSTESRGASRAAERKQHASFRRAFGVTTTLLLVLCAVFLGLAYFQGAKLSSAQFDVTKAVAQPGQQLRLFTNQAIARVAAGQVAVAPSARFTVSSAGSAIAVQFQDRLRYDTEYTVRIKGVTSLYEQQPSTIEYSFRTASSTIYYLHRARPNEPEQVDRIYQTGLNGAQDKEVYSAAHIQEFAAFPYGLAVVTLNVDKSNSLSLVGLPGREVEKIVLPSVGAIENLQADADGGILGFVFTSGDGGVNSEYSSTLMTVNLDLAHTVRPISGLDGKPIGVQAWHFMPGSTDLVAQTMDDSVLLFDAAKQTAAPTPLGHYSVLSGASPDGTSIVVGDVFGNIVYSLSSGKERRVQPLPIDGATPFGGELELIGRGTARVQKVAVYNQTTAKFDILVVLEDGTSSRVLFKSQDGTASIEGISVSPNGQYVVVEETLDTVHSVSDGYFRNARSRNVATVIVDIATGRVVRTLDGFAVAWQ